jgi:cytoskeletal protein RodZ
MKQITKLIFPIAYLFMVQSAFGQIVGQKTDSNYYNTTVVMVKENTTGATVLTAMNDEFGMGDVLRIEVAKPQPKFVVNNITTPATAAPRQINTAPRPTVKPIERNSVVQNKPDSGLSKEQIKPVAKSVVVANPAASQQVQVAAPIQVVKAPKIAKTGTSSAKKAVKKKKCKSRPPFMASTWRKKPGKQKYSCPKF